jgi:hypothetical protein
MSAPPVLSSISDEGIALVFIKVGVLAVLAKLQVFAHRNLVGSFGKGAVEQ